MDVAEIYKMLTFIGKSTADITLEVPNKIVTDCHEYEILEGDEPIGLVYGG